MSDKLDLVLNEAQTTGWLRAEFYGDAEAAKGYLTQARQVLGSMKARHGVNERIAEGQPGGFFRAEQVLPDGTRIEALTNDGHDTVRITASSQPQTPPEPPEIPPPESTSFVGEGTRFAFEPTFVHKEPEYRPLTREFCIWESDQEVYSPPLFGHQIYGPMVDATDHIYMGGWMTGPYVGPAFRHQSLMYQYDPVTMEQGGAFELEFPPLYAQRMHWDAATGKFFLLDGQGAYAVNIYTIYGVAYWDSRTSVARITFPSASDPASSLRQKYIDGSPNTIDGRLLAGLYGDGTFDLYGVDTDTLAQGSVASYSGGGGALATCPTPDGDLVVVETDIVSSHISAVRRIGLTTGRSESYPQPPNEYVHLVEVACTSDGSVWMLQSMLLSDTAELVLYRFDPASGSQVWETVAIDGGLGGRAMLYESVNFTDYAGGIQYDPVSDAVAVLMGDGSGAWIFNATDCLNAPIPEFFQAFAQRPDPESYVATIGQQLYDGRLLVRFEAPVVQLGTEDDTLLDGRSCIGASYVIGMLRQTKIEEPAGTEPVLSSF